MKKYISIAFIALAMALMPTVSSCGINHETNNADTSPSIVSIHPTFIYYNEVDTISLDAATGNYQIRLFDPDRWDTEDGSIIANISEYDMQFLDIRLNDALDLPGDFADSTLRWAEQVIDFTYLVEIKMSDGTYQYWIFCDQTSW